MRRISLLFIALFIMSGCQPLPRYTSPEERASDVDREPVRKRDRYLPESNKDSALTTRENIELGRIIQRYLGIPYGGYSTDSEDLDCSRFTMEVFEKFNRTRLPRTVEEQYKVGSRVGKRQLRYGDLVFFGNNKNSVTHVGIYIGQNEFIHTSSSSGIVISNLNDKYWKKHYSGGRRILP